MLFKPTALMTKAVVAVALCMSSTSVSAAACQPGAAGCVLPVADAPPPPPPPEAVGPVVGPVVAERAGLGLIPILVGLGLAALLAYFLFIDDEDDETPVTP